jgi:transposase
MLMETLFQRVAGLDVHKDSVVACVRVVEGREVTEELCEWATTTDELLGLRDWLEARHVELIGMESTGVYWKPVFYVLEELCECWLLNARHLRNVPGRKTDMADAAWIAKLVQHGLVTPSFVPPKPIRELRNLTRYRKAQIQERTREAQRLDKILQDAGIKLSSVASDTLGVSGRAMLTALIAGADDPAALADLAKGMLRKKLPMLRQALTGRFNANHALIVGEILAKLDYLDEAISRLSAAIDELCRPFEHELELLDTIPGIDRRSAQAMIAEFGVDMSRFGDAHRLASWAGVCPGSHESAGRNKTGKTRKGSKWLQIHLNEAAKSIVRSKGTYLAAQYARIKARRGHAKATVAVELSIVVAAFHILDRHEPYHDLGADYFIRRHDPERHARRLARQIQALGFDVTIHRPDAA